MLRGRGTGQAGLCKRQGTSCTRSQLVSVTPLTVKPAESRDLASLSHAHDAWAGRSMRPMCLMPCAWASSLPQILMRLPMLIKVLLYSLFSSYPPSRFILLLLYHTPCLLPLPSGQGPRVQQLQPQPVGIGRRGRRPLHLGSCQAGGALYVPTSQGEAVRGSTSSLYLMRVWGGCIP